MFVKEILTVKETVLWPNICQIYAEMTSTSSALSPLRYMAGWSNTSTSFQQGCALTNNNCSTKLKPSFIPLVLLTSFKCLPQTYPARQQETTKLNRKYSLTERWATSFSNRTNMSTSNCSSLFFFWLSSIFMILPFWHGNADTHLLWLSFNRWVSGDFRWGSAHCALRGGNPTQSCLAVIWL